MQQQLAAVGVHLTLNQVSATRCSASRRPRRSGGGHLQLDSDDWYKVQPTPADEVNALYTTGASTNYNCYSNPQVDALAAQARKTFDETTRNKRRCSRSRGHLRRCPPAGRMRVRAQVPAPVRGLRGAGASA